jgi:hypothetical protein
MIYSNSYKHLGLKKFICSYPGTESITKNDTVANPNPMPLVDQFGNTAWIHVFTKYKGYPVSDEMGNYLPSAIITQIIQFAGKFHFKKNLYTFIWHIFH